MIEYETMLIDMSSMTIQEANILAKYGIYPIGFIQI